jgi:DnaJ-class molecular chaperone
MDAESSDIKKAFRKLAVQYHPDKNLDKADFDDSIFDKIHEAYETLVNTEKRKTYDESQLILSNTKIIERPKINSAEWENAFRKSLIKKLVELEEMLDVEELSSTLFMSILKNFFLFIFPIKSSKFLKLNST